MVNDGKIRLLRMLELLKKESDEQHPISTPDAIRILKERWGLDAYRITVKRDNADWSIVHGLRVV